MKKLFTSICLCGAAMAFSWGPAERAQQSQAPGQKPTSIKAHANEVVLDVVVRDKKGRPVDDLKAEDFHVTDNGNPETLTSFRLVQGNEAVAAGNQRQKLDPLRQIRLVTMIFQCSSNDARRLARDAALDLLKDQLPQNVYMSVMAIDHKIDVIQAFTNDLALLRKGIDRATRSENSDYSKDTDSVRTQLQAMLGAANGSQTQQGQINDQAAAAGAAAQAKGPNGSAFANLAMVQMLLNMINTAQSNAMTEAGRAEIYALLDAVKEQYRLPGRKTILYFSEGGFTVPVGMEGAFHSVISIANLSNVSFYALDTRGLSTMGSNQSTIEALKSVAQTSKDQQTEGTGRVRPDEVKLFDTAVETTRSNTQNTLADLSESTGGFLISNTNDFRTPLRRLSEDIETYYEITYSPEIKTYDGSFRKIAVATNSSDLRVQSRSGYIALPPSMIANGAVLNTYEVPLLTALNSSELPKAFGFESAALHYRDAQNKSMCDLVVDVPLGDVTLQKNAAGQYAGRLSYVALLKDSKGDVVKKFQNDIPLNVPEEKMGALKSSHFIYTEHFNLDPGNYTLEAAVLDGEGKRMSARKSVVVMPSPSTSLGISGVCVVRSMKDKDKSIEDSDPLVIASKVVSPTIAPVVIKASTTKLPFYVVIYADQSVAAPPQLVMEISRNGEVLGKGSAPLGPPDKDGRIQYIAMAPVAQLEPGNFTIRFIAKQGSETAEESASFTLQ